MLLLLAVGLALRLWLIFTQHDRLITPYDDKMYLQSAQRLLEAGIFTFGSHLDRPPRGFFSYTPKTQPRGTYPYIRQRNYEKLKRELIDVNISKKLAVSSTLIASLVLSPVAVFADEATQTTTVETTVEATGDVEVGLTPDSFFYFFKQLIRDINIYFTDDEKEKAELLLQYANEKAAELQEMNEAANTEYNEEQMKEIEELLTEANDLIVEEDAEQTDVDATETGTGTETETGTVQTDGDVTTEPTPEPTTDTTTEPQQEEPTEEEGTMGPVHALAVLKGLLDKLPEEGRKGVENAIKHLEKNIEKKAKKQKKHQTEDVKTETEAPVTTPTTTTTTNATTNNTTTNTTTAPATTTAPTAEKSTEVTTEEVMPIKPDLVVEEEAKATQQPTPTAPVTKERHDNGLHLGHDKQKDKETKQKENHTPNKEERKNEKN